MQKKLKLGESNCQCAACGQYFNSEAGFNGHRAGSYDDDAKPRRCLSVPEMEAKGFSRNKGGWWITSRRPTMVPAAA